MISSACHCGAVRVEIPAPPEKVTCCNCSICRRLGALWAFYPVDAVRIDAEAGATEDYLWGEQTRRFVRCRRCGCTTHVLPAKPRPEGQIEINVRLFEPEALGPFRLRRFDGAVAWKYLDEEAG